MGPSLCQSSLLFVLHGFELDPRRGLWVETVVQKRRSGLPAFAQNVVDVDAALVCLSFPRVQVYPNAVVLAPREASAGIVQEALP